MKNPEGTPSSSSGGASSNLGRDQYPQMPPDAPMEIEHEDQSHMGGLNRPFVGPASLDRPPDLVPTFTDRPLSRVVKPKRLGALFVDFENIYLSFSDLVTKPLESTIHVLTVLRDELEFQHDINVVLGRAYGSWEYGPARDALSQLSLLGIVPQYVLSRRHKSSADLKLSIDLMEVLLARSDIECYIIVGGDRDYMPIVEKIKERAKDILIISPAQATSGDLIALVGYGVLYRRHHPPAAGCRAGAGGRLAQGRDHVGRARGGHSHPVWPCRTVSVKG